LIFAAKEEDKEDGGGLALGSILVWQMKYGGLDGSTCSQLNGYQTGCRRLWKESIWKEITMSLAVFWRAYGT